MMTVPSLLRPLFRAGRAAASCLVAAGALLACARTAEDPGRFLPAEQVTDDPEVVLPDASAMSDAGPLGEAGAAPDAGAAVDAGADAGAAPGSDAGAADGGSAPDAATYSDAGPASECVPGTYKGAFSGQVNFLPIAFGGLLGVDITGTISISIEADAKGALLTAKNGTVEGTDQDGNPVRAQVTGTLDCATKKLQNGKLVNGTYVRTGTTVSFSGTVTADYSPNPPSATGTWKTSGGLLEGGNGVWSAVLVP